MLQWKPRLLVVSVVLVAIAALLGQLTWDAIDQLTWF
jgi:hypothetical protein